MTAWLLLTFPSVILGAIIIVFPTLLMMLGVGIPLPRTQNRKRVSSGGSMRNAQPCGGTPGDMRTSPQPNQEPTASPSPRDQ